jgi:hypothetical protein
MTARLTGEQYEEMKGRVLAYIADHGPKPLSDIIFAFADVMSDAYLTRFVKQLVTEGKVAAKKERFVKTIDRGGWTQTVPYEARVYSAVKARRRAPRRSR